MPHLDRSVAVFMRLGIVVTFTLTCLAGYPVSAAGVGFQKPSRTVTIGGTAPMSAVVGNQYTFTPSASGGRRRLQFRIQNRPAWAAFSTSQGTLKGIPAASNVGTSSNIRISVTDGYTVAALAPFSITVNASTSNQPPTISGAPPATVAAGSIYSFQPVANDTDGDPLSFSIQGKPAWAAFSIATGQLSGTPSTSQVGTYSGILVSVSDGKSSVSLPAFSITVTSPATQPPPPSTGSATLTWIPPTRNTDGSTLTNLAGYDILYGTSASNPSNVIEIANPGLSSYTIAGLVSGTWYFEVVAYSALGMESAPSNEASKTIP